MFTREQVVEADNSVEATARFWLWRASIAGTAAGQESLASKVIQAEPGVRGPIETGNIEKNYLVFKMTQLYGDTMPTADSADVHEALLADLHIGLEEEGVVEYRTDYTPIGRLALALDGHSKTGFPIKTTTYTHPELAYVVEQGEPITIIHGGIAAQQFVAERFGRLPGSIPILGTNV
jgi:hypothetical protein